MKMATLLCLTELILGLFESLFIKLHISAEKYEIYHVYCFC